VSRTSDICDRVLIEIPLNGEVIAIAALATKLDVHPSTIRRAVEKLEREGTIEWKSRGRVARRGDLGAAADFKLAEPSVVGETSAASKTIARMIDGAETVVLDWSEFALSVAQEVGTAFAGNIITNSPSIALALRNHPSATIRVIGGKLRDMLVKADSEELESFKTIVANPCVLGGCRIDMKNERLIVTDQDEAKVKRAMIENASTVVVPIASDDLAEEGGFIVGYLKDITHLILQNGISAANLKKCEGLGITIIRD
jgi:DeoR/GlpR family transcriptional regulator of sugar metabolism